MKQTVAVLCLLATLAMSIQMIKSGTTESITEICLKESGATKEAIEKGEDVFSRAHLCYTWTPENQFNIENLRAAYSLGNRSITLQNYKTVMYTAFCNRVVVPDADMCIAYNQTLNCIAEARHMMNKRITNKEICMAITGSTEEAIDEGQAVRSRDHLCQMACVYNLYNIWTPDNKIILENYEKMINKTYLAGTEASKGLVKTMETCIERVIPDPDRCLAYNQTYTCQEQEGAKNL